MNIGESHVNNVFVSLLWETFEKRITSRNVAKKEVDDWLKEWFFNF